MIWTLNSRNYNEFVRSIRWFQLVHKPNENWQVKASARGGTDEYKAMVRQKKKEIGAWSKMIYGDIGDKHCIITYGIRINGYSIEYYDVFEGKRYHKLVREDEINETSQTCCIVTPEGLLEVTAEEKELMTKGNLPDFMQQAILTLQTTKGFFKDMSKKRE